MLFVADGIVIALEKINSIISWFFVSDEKTTYGGMFSTKNLIECFIKFYINTKSSTSLISLLFYFDIHASEVHSELDLLG